MSAYARAAKVDPVQLANAFSYDPGKGSLTNERASASVDSWQSNLYGLGEAVTGKVGLQGAQKWMRSGREDNEFQAEVASGRAKALGGVNSYKDVDGLGSAANYFLGRSVEVAPFLLPVFILVIAFTPSRRWAVSQKKRFKSRKKMNSNSTSLKLKGVGGWLLTMCILLMYAGPLFTLISTAATIIELDRRIGFLAPSGYAGYKAVTWLTTLAIMGLSFWTGWQLKNKLVPETIERVKKLIWLLFVGGYALGALIIPTIFFGTNGDIIGRGVFSGLASVIAAAFYVLYLSKSKRVRSTYGLDSENLVAATVHAPSIELTKKIPFAQTDQVQVSVKKPQSASDALNMASALAEQVIDVDEDQIYTAIAQELEANTTDKGLWTRLFAQCNGDQNLTKANYIKERAAKLIDVAHFQIQERLKIQTLEFEKQRLFSELGPLIEKFESGNVMKNEEVAMLVNAALSHAPLVNMKDIKDGYSLLHWCAIFGFNQLAEALLLQGADASAKDASGKQAHEFSRGAALAEMLKTAANRNQKVT